MPKVEGGTLEKCMEVCMSDEKLKSEKPHYEDRQDICYAACAEKYGISDATYIEYLISKYKEEFYE